VNEESETNSEEGGQRPVEVRCLLEVPEVSSSLLIRAVEVTIEHHPVIAISVAVVDDHTITHLNQRYKEKTEPTDVLAFDLRDDASAPLEGEVVVSADTARRQAAELGVDFAEELLRYVIHGTLHLLGHTDETKEQREKMHQEEDRVLAKLRNHPGEQGRKNRGV